MTCVACRQASGRVVCDSCRRSLHPASDRVLGGVFVRSAFRHEGAARALVHRLKYEAVWGVAERLAGAMVPLLPGDAIGLVPVPRVAARRRAFGIDPARALADAVGRAAGLPVLTALRPRMWVPRRAGPAGQSRGTPGYELIGRPSPLCVLVDDVVTSGATLAAAAAACRVSRAVTATAGHSALTSNGAAP